MRLTIITRREVYFGNGKTAIPSPGKRLRRTSTPMSGPVEVMVEALEADLKKVEGVFRQVGIPIIGVEEIEVER